MIRKFWNLADAGEALELSVDGVIDGGLLDATSASSKELLDAIAAAPKEKKITTRINSAGGSLFGGIAIYNALQARTAPVVSHVIGLAASAASVAAMAGRTVMAKESMMMVHRPSVFAAGHSDDLRKMADVLDEAKKLLTAIYVRKTRKSAFEINAMLDAETWFTADDAKREGFADEVLSAGASLGNLAHGRVVNAAGGPANIAALRQYEEERRAIRQIAGGIRMRGWR